ncbi:ribonuclease P protein component [Xanthobacter autotrophicus DSM 431]|uniref:ribonuclease P protein component n=1 Tax=Xanthobacter nonsaccharivorans TaxID=3119912 RepID=UPI0037262DD2
MDRLRKRRDFLAAAKALRAGTAPFLMQGRDRGDADGMRVGFTVTKKTGNAVVRNRIRRRLREVARKVLPEAGRPGFDYVLVAREAALRTPFETLVRDLERALRKLDAPARPKSDAKRDPGGKRDPGPGRGRPERNRTPDGRKAAAQGAGGPDKGPRPAPAAAQTHDLTDSTSTDPSRRPPTEALRHD